MMPASHSMNFLEASLFRWRSLQMYRLATTHTYHPCHLCPVLWPYRTSWSMDHSRVLRSIQCGFFAKGLELQIRPTSSNLALDSWIWRRSAQHWFGNCLPSSTNQQACSWKPQCPLDKPDDDDDDESVVRVQYAGVSVVDDWWCSV